MEQTIGTCDVCNLTREISCMCERCESVICNDCFSNLTSFDYKMKDKRITDFCVICKDILG
jgi:hypothetical protein